MTIYAGSLYLLEVHTYTTRDQLNIALFVPCTVQARRNKPPISLTTVKVVQNRSPFGDAEDETRFLALMADLLAHPDVIPDEYGVIEAEWDDEGYPEIEVFRPGTKGNQRQGDVGDSPSHGMVSESCSVGAGAGLRLEH
ncbi:hypothetical protein R3P38DRAFT_2807943 [Favolaschia claudopus]|uniref:Uncharacterized protein n=1 Tax=Favolaschia claudopus TaxID=2862362 RepID=A0AAV9ZI44_9AGAR